VDPALARAEQVRRGLWRLRIPLAWHHANHVNAYVLEDRDEGVILVDAGPGGHHTAHRALEEGLTRSGRRLDAVATVLATHFHTDHIGSAAYVVRRSGARLLAPQGTDHFDDAVREPLRVAATRASVARAAGVPASVLPAHSSVRDELEGAERVDPDLRLRSGDVLDTALGPMEVVETPGHAPAQLALHLVDQRVLLSADLVLPVFSTFVDWGYSRDPIGEYRSSLERVMRLDVDRALPGHGRPIEDLRDRIEQYRRGIAQRLGVIEAAVRRGPTTAWQVQDLVFGHDEHPATTVWRTSEVLGYLRHLAIGGRILEHADGEPVMYEVARRA
jgi:glyoxylase-like metal-dependent hydrolase (beta-lactamase superfamily II)